MNFFKKRGVAWTLCILMILSALFIGHYKQFQSQYEPDRQTEAEQWGWDNFSAYERYLADETDTLTKKEEKLLSVYNASFDYTYDSVFGIRIAEQVQAPALQGEDQQVMQELGLGERDYLLLMDLSAQEWVLYSGAEAEEHRDHSLDLLVTESCNDFFQGNHTALLKLFSKLETWHQENTPPANYTDHILQTVKVIGKTATYILVAGLILAGLVLTAIICFVRKCWLQYAARSKAAPGQKKPQRASERYSEPSKTQYSSEHYQKTHDTKKESF